MGKLRIRQLVGIFLVLTSAAVAQEDATLIALADFENATGDSAYDPYTSGLAEAIGTFIARSGIVQLVERSRLQSVIDEQNLGLSGVLDEESATEVGRLLGAQAVILGSYLLEGDRFQVNARMIDTETGRVLTAEQAGSAELLQAADEVAVGLLRQLGIEVIETKRSSFKRIGRWIFLGLGTGAGLGAASAQSQGNQAYTRYGNSVIESEITKNYNEAKDKDSQRNLLIGVCTGSVITAAYLYLTSRQPDRIYRRMAEEKVALGMSVNREGRALISLTGRF